MASSGPNAHSRNLSRPASRRPMLARASTAGEDSGEAAESRASARSNGSAAKLRSQTAKSSGTDNGRMSHHPTAGTVKDGSVGSVTFSSRSQPSFSSLMCWIATAFAFASRSGIAWYSETQQRYTL